MHGQGGTQDTGKPSKLAVLQRRACRHTARCTVQHTTNQGEHDMEQTNLNELLAAINEAHAAGNQQELVAELEASLEVFETI